MLLNYTPSQPLLAFLFLMAAFAFKSVFVFLALHLLYATSALLFPPPLALFASTLGTFLTISIPYFIARRRGASYADKLKVDAHPFIQKIARTMSDAPLRFVLMIRFVGLFPCDLVSAYFGAKRTPYAAYALGSVIGFLPVDCRLHDHDGDRRRTRFARVPVRRRADRRQHAVLPRHRLPALSRGKVPRGKRRITANCKKPPLF